MQHYSPGENLILGASFATMRKRAVRGRLRVTIRVRVRARIRLRVEARDDTRFCRACLRSISAELGYCTESARFTFLAKLKISSAASSIQVLTYDARFSLHSAPAEGPT